MHLLAFETIQLFPDGTLFIHIALILLMIWVLNRTFFRPINRVLETREKHKGGYAGEAAGILKEVETKTSLYSKEMLDARSKGYDLVASEQQKSAAARTAKLETAKAEIAANFETQKAELETQKATARAAVGSEAEKMAEQITTNILGS